MLKRIPLALSIAFALTTHTSVASPKKDESNAFFSKAALIGSVSCFAVSALYESLIRLRESEIHKCVKDGFGETAANLAVIRFRDFVNDHEALETLAFQSRAANWLTGTQDNNDLDLFEEMRQARNKRNSFFKGGVYLGGMFLVFSLVGI